MVLGKVGLTGATGMLGCHLRAALEIDGLKVTSVARSACKGISGWDLTRWLTFEELDKIFSEVDVVVHAGAMIEYENDGREGALFDANVRSCMNLAEWATHRSIPLIFISSGSVYANPDSGFLVESAPLGFNRLSGFYGASKLIAEDIFRRYESSGLKLVIIRPSSLYGFGGSKNIMIYKFLGQAVIGKTIELVQPIDDQIDFLHAADLSEVIIRVIRKHSWGHTFNVSSGVPASIYEVASICVEVAGKGSVVVLGDDEKSTRQPIKRFFLDSSAARKELDWTPKVGLRQGIEFVQAGKLLPENFFTESVKRINE
jgi:nucleoside-diphosphate-sugar epimerase